MKTSMHVALFGAILSLSFIPMAKADVVVTSPQGMPAQLAPAQAEVKPKSPSDVVRGFYTQLVDVMKQGDQLGFSGRYKKLEPSVRASFNLPLMTRYAVGLDWAKATHEEQQALTSAFSDYSVATYANQFKAYDGEVFEVAGEKPSGDGVMVETKLTPKGHEPVELNYLMKTDEQGQWRIVDVFLDGAISQIAAQRSQFTSIVRRDGISALVNSLGDKTKQMGPS